MQFQLCDITVSENIIHRQLAVFDTDFTKNVALNDKSEFHTDVTSLRVIVYFDCISILIIAT